MHFFSYTVAYQPQNYPGANDVWHYDAFSSGMIESNFAHSLSSSLTPGDQFTVLWDSGDVTSTWCDEPSTSANQTYSSRGYAIRRAYNYIGTAPHSLGLWQWVGAGVTNGFSFY